MPTPEEVIGQLATFPIALLPIRLETRFSPGLRELRIRIYPDQVHLDGHRRELSDGEITTGQAYWRSRWAGQAEDAWLDLTRGMRPARARWVINATTPINIDQLGDPNGPVFGNLEATPAQLGAVARATALPAQWLVVGYQGGQEVVRVHSNPVAPDLALSLLDEDAPTSVDGDQPLARDAAWLADYDRAVAAGMAVTVSADRVGGAGFDAGLNLLVVLGVSAGGTPASDATVLDDLLAAHSYADGLSLLATGVATNDTSGVRPAPSRPEVHDPATAAGAAGTRLRKDLGLTDGSTLDGVPLTGPDTSKVDLEDVEQAAGSMVDALWSATLGYALEQLFSPTVNRADIRAARAHARDHLRPAGRYPVVQVGRQPYGVLPIVAPKHLSSPVAPGGTIGLLQHLRPIWANAADQLPRLAPDAPGAEGDVDSTFFQLLRLAPVSSRYRFRTVLGPMLTANTAGLTGAANLQSQLRDLVFTGVLGAAQPPRLASFCVHPRQWALRLPLIGPGTGELQPNYLNEIADTLRRADSRPQLVARRPGSLLEALVTLAAIHEIDAAITQLAGRHAPATSPLRRAPWRTPELPGVTAASGPSPRRLAEVTLPALGRPLLTVLSELLAQAESDPSGAGADRDVVDGLLALLRAVQSLVPVKPAVLEGAMTGFLDACSHRLDAWFTSVASAQLAAIRADQPEGVYLGAYGWVERVRPETRPDSAGYLLGPSLAHASAAAVLRSGYQTHQDEGDDAFDIDLTSQRAEDALELLRAVGAGTRLGQILGYHLERGLHDRGLQRLVQAMRAIAPLHPGPPRLSGLADAPLDADVVDGETLLRRRDAVHAALAAEPATVFAQVDAELDRLADRLDAVGDLATSEAVYQLALGRPERMRAALALLDRQDQAPEPEITQTPQRGTGFVHRVLVALTDTAPAAGWAGIQRDARATAEPRLDAWLGRLLGPPERWVFTGRAVDAQGIVLGQTTTDLRRLGLSPLALVLATGASTPGRPSQVEDRVARVLAVTFGPQPPGATLELQPDTPGALGLAAFLAHAGAIRMMLEQSRPGDANAFAPPDAIVPAGIDIADLAARADIAAATFAAAHDRLGALLSEPTPGVRALRDALDAADAAGANGAAPPFELLTATVGGAPEADSPASVTLLTLARSVAAAMAGTRAQLTVINEEPTPGTPTDAAARQRRRLELLLGSSAPILPTFRLDEAATTALRASVAVQGELTAGDPLAPATWFTRMSRVRKPVGTLWRALVGAEAVTAGFAPDQIVVAQRPQGDGERWIGLEYGPEVTPRADLALVVVAPGGAPALSASAESGMSAMVVDGWSELVPAAAQSCGLAFQYDAPGNRAPQAWLLAVPPDMAATNWTAEQLLDTVIEAADLAAVRAVTLADIPTAGPVLPAIYLPTTLGQEVAGIDLDRWVPAGPMVLGRD